MDPRTSLQPYQPVVLVRMPQQTDILGAEEDWTGLTSPAQRRRLQNRINQRAHRNRKAGRGKSKGGQVAGQEDGSSSSREASTEEDQTQSQRLIVCTKKQSRQFRDSDPRRMFQPNSRQSRDDLYKPPKHGKICAWNSREMENLISEFEKWAMYCQSMGSPNADNLLVLVKFNVFRALMSNCKDLGLSTEDTMPDEALSPFADPNHPKRHFQVKAPALQPTKLQQEIPHHPWIDQIPIPGMRDNLLRAGDTWDDVQLCGDLLGFFSPSTGKRGMIVWGEAWDPAAWEVTEAFLSYWGWTIRGCTELAKSTNYWREKRGEDPLEFDKVLIEEVPSEGD